MISDSQLPRKWSDLQFNTSRLNKLIETVEANRDINPACKLGPYWRERRGPEMLAALENSPGLPTGFVGNGWPEYSSQEWVANGLLDTRVLHKLFASRDLHTRDGGDAVYQANRILDENLTPTVADLGSGYGRLAYPLIGHAIKVYGVDFSPIGLLLAPQFISQLTCAKVSDWNASDTEIAEAWFCSLPAWKLETVPPKSIDVFVSVHSFQEMEAETIEHYITWAIKRARPSAKFYSVNLNDPDYIPESWELLCDKPYPINRDGSYNERIWRIL